MSFDLFRSARLGLLAAVVAVAACASDPAPNFRGKWRSVNDMAEAPVAIPLYESFVYSSGPQDRTLKSMLTRWAQGSKRTLSYLNSNDYTLYGPVEQINTPSLEQAVGQLNAAYGPYGVVITLEPRQIIVRQGGQSAAPPPAP